MKRSYPKDPLWIKAKFLSVCCRCKRQIKKGDKAFYYPNSKTIYCESDSCGKQEERDFAANMFDERGMM